MRLYGHCRSSAPYRGRIALALAGPPARDQRAVRRQGTPEDSGAADQHIGCHAGKGSALVHLISSRQTLERTTLTPGMRIRVSIRNWDSDLRSRAMTLIT